MPAGRPTKYDPIYCEQIIDKMSQGYSVEAFAGSIRVSKDTIYEWLKHYPEFSDAKKVAETVCQEFWERQAVQNLVNMYKGSSLNTGVWAFNMKNRFGWRDKKEIEHSGEVKKSGKLVIDLSGKETDDDSKGTD